MQTVRRVSICGGLILVLLNAGSSVARQFVTTNSNDQPVSERDLASLRDITPLLVNANNDLDPREGGFRISPDGRRFAYQLRTPEIDANRYTITWYVGSLLDGSSRPIADAGDVRLQQADGIPEGSIIATSDIKWAPDGRRLAFLKAVRGAIELYVAAADGSGSERISSGDFDVNAFAWSAGGHSLLYRRSIRSRQDISRARDEELLNGLLVRDDSSFVLGGMRGSTPADVGGTIRYHDVDTGEDRLATAEEAATLSSDRSQVEIPAALGGSGVADGFVREQIRQQSTREWRQRLTPGVAAPIRLRGPGERFAGAIVDRPADRLLYPSSRVVFVDGDSPNRVVRCDRAECHGSIQTIWSSPNGEEIIFENAATPDAFESNFYGWNPRTGRLRLILHNETALSHCTMTSAGLLCIYSTPTRPPVIAMVNLTNGRIRTLVDPNPQFPRPDPRRVERLAWRDSNSGLSTISYLVKPIGYRVGRRYPLVIVTFRPEGFLRGGRGNEYPVHTFASKGMAVLVFARPFENLMRYGSDWRFSQDSIDRRQVNDLLEIGIRNLVARGVVDPQRIAITGLSDGGSMTYWALARGRIPYAAGIASTTGNEPIDYYLMSRNGRHMFSSWMHLERSGPHGAIFDTTSPSTMANDFKAPLLLNLPDSEVLSATQTFVSLEQAGKQVETYVFPGEYHEKWQPAHRYVIYRRNVQWLQFWLQGVEDREPVDPDQYQRWSALRQQLRRPPSSQE